MGEHTKEEFPYKSLGAKLKKMRQKQQETIAEVSGAVEIDAAVLTEIEQGKQRPSEDILMLLISYFSVKEDEAVSLWEMAGYNQPGKSESKDIDTSQPVLVMPIDVRIVYADIYHVTANDYGVVMNFLQSSGPNGKPLAVGRVGMSREHAEKVLDQLQKALHPEVKKLPAPKPETDQ